MQEATCALATGRRYSIGDSAAPRIESGGNRSPPRAHAAQRSDHAIDRAPDERFVTREHAVERLRREHAGEQPQRGAGIRAIQHRAGLGDGGAANGEGLSAARDVRAERARAGQGRGAVGAGIRAPHLDRFWGEQPEQDRAVRDRLVARG